MAKTYSMRLINDHRWIRRVLLKATIKAGDRTLCFLADGVGIVVAEIRMTIFPTVGKIAITLKSSSALLSTVRPLFFHSSHLKSMTTAVDRRVADRTVVVRLPTNQNTLGKKYTYDWAVTRIFELEQVGIADPVSYFNNEMADWWLAPGGMMEDEADFVGIARAIEERWHS